MIQVWSRVRDIGEPHHLYGIAEKDVRIDRLRGILTAFHRIPPDSSAHEHAAFLLFRIVVDQPFSDCNHRTGWAVTDYLLTQWGFEFVADPDEVKRFVLAISDVRPSQQAETVEWLKRAFRRPTPAS